MKPRKTMTEMAAEASGISGWSCQKCGCNDWRVLDTRLLADGTLSRTRCCRHCGPDGPRIYTDEVPRDMK